MRDVYRSLLTALAGVLALWLILGFWPLSIGSRVALSLLVMLVCGAMLWRQRRVAQIRAQALREIGDESLPPEDFQGAVILVCGDNTAFFAEGTPYRETRQGWYLRVKDAGQLPCSLSTCIRFARRWCHKSPYCWRYCLNVIPWPPGLPIACAAGSVAFCNVVRLRDVFRRYGQ